MARPIILGIVGDSASGKTTLSRGLVQALGADAVTHVCTDDYHRYDRTRRAEVGITPLDPECNYIDIMAQHLSLLRAGEPILKPVYQHATGTFGPPVYVNPGRFLIIEGLLGYHTEELRDSYDVRVYLDPPEELRRSWKVSRDTRARGYTADQVLADLDRREPDSESFIRPQARHADLVVRRSCPPGRGDSDHLDGELIVRDGLPHPDLTPFVEHPGTGIQLTEPRDGERLLCIPGALDREQALLIEESIWDRLHFASHLRSGRLGEVTIGGEQHRSESLGLVQLLILYHLATATATVALGGVER
ncbi:MAG: phosphoribulokinase [Thermoleophilaceae bacterium]|jgi:phosphoribulokinase|nr:phosphoribulokinase [Thermoleophilaceae bacterium]MEA2349601.1 phosphoribulokinase [Thermoleophilaceae bacterium]